jgi:hypothetical protein
MVGKPLPTSLAHGAGLHHIRRYLGHVSIRMTEHYAKVATSEIEDILQHIWVAGPAAPNPGELLSDPATPMDRRQAEALMIDLSRASTPTEGGFCTYQPVVHGGACPWNLNCHSCDKFVLSGADLLYWLRKREQWASIAERAPDNATADYLHQVFAPTAQASLGWKRPSPDSACSTKRSRWTCGVPRTTTTGCGTCRSAPPTSPQLLAARPRRKDAE